MVRIWQGIQPEREASVPQRVGQDPFSRITVVPEQHCSERVLRIQSGGLSQDQRTF